MDLIHYDEETDAVTYDSELPERTRINYEIWRK